MGDRARKAHDQSKGKTTDYGQVGLPSGLRGIAQLREIEINQISEGKQNAGELYFRATATILTPEKFKGEKIKDRTTSKVIWLFNQTDQKGKITKTFESEFDKMLNELRKLGVETDAMEGSDEELEVIFEELLTARPHIKYHTFGGPNPEFPNARVQESWDGITEFDEEDEEHTEVAGTNGVPPSKRREKAEEETNFEEVDPPKPKPAPKKKSPSKPDPEPEPEEVPVVALPLPATVTELAEAVQNGAGEREKELVDLALQQGISLDDVQEADTWTDVGEMILATLPSGSEEPEEEEEDDEEFDEDYEEEEEEPEQVSENPEVGSIWVFSPPSKKSPKVRLKARQCEVTTVNQKKRTVTLKDVEKGTLYKAVAWDDLDEVPEELGA